MTSAKQARASVLELFMEVTASISWGTIDEYYEAVKTNGELVSALLHGDISERIIKDEIRRLIKQEKNGEGHPIFASVKSEDEKGNLVSLYKQETLFDMSDYQQCADYHGQRVLYHAGQAIYYKNRAARKFNGQIHLPFNEDAIFLD